MVNFQSNVSVILSTMNNFLGSFYCECTHLFSFWVCQQVVIFPCWCGLFLWWWPFCSQGDQVILGKQWIWNPFKVGSHKYTTLNEPWHQREEGNVLSPFMFGLIYFSNSTIQFNLQFLQCKFVLVGQLLLFKLPKVSSFRTLMPTWWSKVFCYGGWHPLQPH
jgi:hypothetical protein